MRDPVAASLDDDTIRRLVERFYARVRDDAMLAPVFAARVGDWAPHLDRMVEFWTTVLRGVEGYRGNPGRVHAGIAELTPAHFDRWLGLFAETCAESLPADVAAALHQRARGMAVGLQRAAFGPVRIVG